MKTSIIMPEHSDVLARFVETIFPGAVETDSVRVIIQPIEPEFGTVCLVPDGYRWPKGEDDRDHSRDVADTQADTLFEIFEHGYTDEDPDGPDFETGARVYIGYNLVIRGVDAYEPLRPRDVDEMLHCLRKTILPEKVRFSLAVSMLNQSQSKQWVRELYGEVRIRPDFGVWENIPEGYEYDPIAMFFHLVGLYNGFRWKRRLYEFWEDFYGDLQELIYDAIYADCN